MSVQTRYLHNDTVMCQTIHERVGQPLRHDVVIIVTRLVAHVQHRFLYVAHLMAQQINGHHRQGMSPIRHVLRIRIVYAQILPEAQRLSVQPSLLQFYQNKVLMAVSLPYGCAEVDAEHRQGVAVLITILVGAHLHGHHVLLQQSRENGTRYAFILHQVLEDNVIYRVCYYHNLLSFITLWLQSYTFFRLIANFTPFFRLPP